MTYPANGPATREAVKSYVGKSAADHDARIDRIVAAVNAYVLGLPVAAVADGAADWEAPQVAAVVEGAVMLAGRLYRRKNTPDGAAPLSASGVFSVARADPDVALLLGLGAHARPGVG